MHDEKKFLQITLKRLLRCCQHVPGIPCLDSLAAETDLAQLERELVAGNEKAAEKFIAEWMRRDMSAFRGGDGMDYEVDSYMSDVEVVSYCAPPFLKDYVGVIQAPPRNSASGRLIFFAGATISHQKLLFH